MQTMKIEESTDDATTNLTLDTIKRDKQTLIFVNSKKSAERQAEDIAKILKLETAEWINLGEAAAKTLPKPTKQCKRLKECLRKGVAFHHSGLHQKQRQLVEEAFRNGEIKVICATPTLAAGLDLPAFRVILRDTKRYHERYGMLPIQVLEYLQMIGRGGRPKYDNYGEGICIAKNDGHKEEIYNTYICGEPENIQSKLAVEPVLRTYLLSLIASEIISSDKEIINFFGTTFWAYQYGDIRELESKIKTVLEMLREWGFLESDRNESRFIPADRFSNLYKATRLGKRISELYLDPLTASEFIECLRKAAKLDALKPISFLHMISSALEMRPMPKIKIKEMGDYQEKAGYYQPYLLKNEPAVYDYESENFLAALKNAMMLQEWSEERDEEYLAETYGTTPGELHSKIEISEWLLYTASEIAKINRWNNLINELTRLRIRIRYGIKDELLPLVKIRNIGRARARILYKNGIRDIKDLKNADINKLALLIGAAVAVQIKEEIGEEIKEPIKIRKEGQTSLTKKWQR